MLMKLKVLIISFLFLLSLFSVTPAKAEVIPLKVVILTTYTVEDIARVPPEILAGETKRWYDKTFPTRNTTG